jgi:hypothetical protein
MITVQPNENNILKSIDKIEQDEVNDILKLAIFDDNVNNLDGNDKQITIKKPVQKNKIEYFTE